MKPITKKQTILKAIGEADASKLPKPSTKLETYLYIVCKGSGKIPEPTTREEVYLAYWAAQNGGTGYSNSVLPKPVTRKEVILNALAKGQSTSIEAFSRYETYLKVAANGGNGKYPTPQTVEEYYLLFFAQNMKDDNTYGNIVLDKTSITIDENATATLQVKLASAPTANQTVTIKTSNGNATVNKTSLSFTTSNYNTYQSITITGTHLASNFNANNCVLTFSSKKVADKTITVTVNNIDADTTPYMYYGRLSFQDVGGSVIQYSQITEAMIKKGVADGKLTKTTPKTMGKTSMGVYADTAEMDYIIVAVPTSKNYKVTKDNGIGGKMAFDEETAGANGVDITINNVACKLYGEMLLSQGEYFIYVD
ncbi:hypothetical protein [Gemella morbillorum]